MKFRVWNDKEKKFEDPERYLVDSRGKLYYREPMDETIEPAKLYLTYQHSTKMVDMSGIEIFEGDIVTYNCWDGEFYCNEFNRTREVEYHDGQFFPRPITELCEDPYYSWGIRNIKVIGNIFTYEGQIDFGKRTTC